MWIPNGMKRLRAHLLGCETAMVYQSTADAAVPHVWFDEDRVELTTAIIAGENRSKTDYRASDLGHKNAALLDLINRDLNRVAGCKQASPGRQDC
jgi:hypothetical protein